MTEVVDGTAEEVDADVQPTLESPPPVPSTAVARRERRSEVIRPFDADQLAESFREYQALLPKLLVANDYQAADGKKFVKKSGWRKIATAFDLDVVLVRDVQVERDDNGQPVRAKAWARAIAPSGRSMDGDGYCSADEPRFQNARGRKKLENDLCATATTRAQNRAISGLVGMGEVSAEEVTAGEFAQPSLPKWAEPASDKLQGGARRAIAYVLGETDPVDERVTAVIQRLCEQAGVPVIPALAARALVELSAEFKQMAEGAVDAEA